MAQTRLNINISANTAQALREVADKSGITITEAARRLIGTGKYIMDAQDRGHTIKITHKNGGPTDVVRFQY